MDWYSFQTFWTLGKKNRVVPWLERSIIPFGLRFPTVWEGARFHWYFLCTLGVYVSQTKVRRREKISGDSTLPFFDSLEGSTVTECPGRFQTLALPVWISSCSYRVRRVFTFHHYSTRGPCPIFGRPGERLCFVFVRRKSPPPRLIGEKSPWISMKLSFSTDIVTLPLPLGGKGSRFRFWPKVTTLTIFDCDRRLTSFSLIGKWDPRSVSNLRRLSLSFWTVKGGQGGTLLSSFGRGWPVRLLDEHGVLGRTYFVFSTTLTSFPSFKWVSVLKRHCVPSQTYGTHLLTLCVDDIFGT